MKSALVGVIGHVDHGKTALVRGADRHRYRPAGGGEAAPESRSCWASRI